MAFQVLRLHRTKEVYLVDYLIGFLLADETSSLFSIQITI